MAENSLDIRYRDEQGMLADTAVSFLRSRSTFEHVRRWIGDEAGYDPDLWQEMAGLGWLGIALPEEYGGTGLGAAELVCVCEPMGRYLMASPFLASTLAGQALLKGASGEQKQGWLPRIASGKAVATLALSEPDGSWEPERFSATAEKDGDGYRLSGIKTLVLDGQNADLILIAVTLGGAPALLAAEKHGLAGRLRPEILVDETRRSARLDLDGLALPASALLGGDAAGALRHVYSLAWLLLAAEQAGGADGVFDLTLEYVRTRRQFGKVIGGYQAIKHPMVDLMMEIENTRSLLYHAATVFDGPGGESGIAARMVKAYATDTFQHAADRSIQFHGAMGFTYECHAQLFFRRAQWTRHSFGDAAHHRRHLADALL